MKNNAKEFDEGYEAFDKEKEITDNPYDTNDDRHLSWNDGFMQAEQEFYGDDNGD